MGADDPLHVGQVRGQRDRAAGAFPILADHGDVDQGVYLLDVRSGRVEPGTDGVGQSVLCREEEDGAPLTGGVVRHGTAAGEPGGDVQEGGALAQPGVAVEGDDLSGGEVAGPEPGDPLGRHVREADDGGAVRVERAQVGIGSAHR